MSKTYSNIPSRNQSFSLSVHPSPNRSRRENKGITAEKIADFMSERLMENLRRQFEATAKRFK